MSKLNILWTNADPITAEKMVCMYANNAKIHGWWDQITIIIWGSTAALVAGNKRIQDLLKDMIKNGVLVSACKACADELGVTPQLESLGIEVKYWGDGLTDILKNDEKLLTI